MSKAAIVVLCAGGWARTGTSQRLRDTVKAACGSGCSPVIVVFDTQDDAMREALAGLAVEPVVQELSGGMGVAIQAGLGALTNRDISGAILMSANQTFITAEYLRGLVTTHFESLKTIVASKYSDTVGIPAYFGCSAFPRLMALKPDEGCDEVIQDPGADVLAVVCPEAKALVVRRS